MATYAEFLKSQGATDEDVKLLDTPLARKAHDTMQAQVTEATETQRRANQHFKDMEEWHKGVEAINIKLATERDSANVERAGAIAKLKAAQEAGLITLAEIAEPGSSTPRAGETPAFDASKYVDRDMLLQVAAQEGDAIATFADIQSEHHELFGTRINARELRKEAISRRIPVEQLWMEKYGVAAKRTEVAAAKTKAHEDSIRLAARKEVETEMASKYANPLTAPPRASENPFSTRPPSVGEAAAQPWNLSDSARSNARLQKVMTKINAPGGNA